MNKTFGAVLGVAAILTSSANAATLSFDDLALGSTFQYVGAAQYHGYLFNQTSLAIDVTTSSFSGTGPAHSGENALFNNLGGNIVITADGGGSFLLSDLWIRSWFNGTSATGPSLMGYAGDSLAFTVPFSLTANWQNVAGNDTAITKLVIAGSGRYVLVDDITLNPGRSTSVPEHSSTFLLLGVGLTALTLVRRKLA